MAIVKNQKTGTVLVVSSGPNEMAESQRAMAVSMRVQLENLRGEEDNASAILQQVRLAGLKPDGAKRAHRKAVQRREACEKMVAALEAGYLPMPRIGFEPIAIRTDDVKPRQKPTTSTYVAPGVIPERPKCLPVGKGDNVAAYPEGEVAKAKAMRKRSDGTEYEVTEYTTHATKFLPVELPVEFLKPEVIARTSAALEARIFDEVGIVRETGGDPLVIGIIRRPWRRHDLGAAFLIAHFVDTADLMG